MHSQVRPVIFAHPCRPSQPQISAPRRLANSRLVTIKGGRQKCSSHPQDEHIPHSTQGSSIRVSPVQRPRGLASQRPRAFSGKGATRCLFPSTSASNTDWQEQFPLYRNWQRWAGETSTVPQGFILKATIHPFTEHSSHLSHKTVLKQQIKCAGWGFGVRCTQV